MTTTTTAPPPTQDSLSQALDSAKKLLASERFIRALDAHVAAEADDIARCERFADSSDSRATRIVLNLIAEGGRRHQALLQAMIGRLHAGVDPEDSGAALPVPSDDSYPELSKTGEATAQLRSLIRDEQEGARYLRHLARQQSDLHDGFFSLLLDVLARENETHVHLLRYLLRRLEAV